MVSKQQHDVNTKKSLRPLRPKLAQEVAPPSIILSAKLQRTYKCTECPELFFSFRQLKIHETTHGLDGISICKYCCSLLANEEALDKHNKELHVDSKYVCLPCDKQYKHKGYLLKHIASAHDRNQLIYYCCLCPRQEVSAAYDSKLALQQHFQAVHLHMPIFDMTIDMNEEFLDEFLLQNSNENSFQFSEWDELDLHLSDVHHVNQQPTHQNEISDTRTAAYKCSNCYEMFANQKTLFAHLTQVHYLKLLICNKCDASFQNMEDLCKHITTHRSYGLNQPNINVNVCKICEKSYKSAAALSSHIKTHFNQCLQPHTCPYCSKTFQTHINLKQHLRIVHIQIKKHICLLCDRQFSTLDHLKKHVLSQHQNERKHVCSVCSKRFTQLCHLKQHLEIHTTGKKMQCNVCSATFWRKIDLKRHALVKHVKKDNI